MSPTTSGSDLNSPSFSSTTLPPSTDSNSNCNSNIDVDVSSGSASHTPSPSRTQTNNNPLPHNAIPSSILVVGAGVFGLSTALSLTTRPEFAHTTITVIDRSPEPGVFPARDASSIDTSRIIRADYSDPAYASLAAEAQDAWRARSHPDDLGAQGRYSETGLMLVADAGEKPSFGTKTGLDYVRHSWDNVRALHPSAPERAKIRELPTRVAIRSAYGTGGATGNWGYVNGLSGWADAEASMAWLYRRVAATGRVAFVNGTVASLVYGALGRRVYGVKLASGATWTADLTILATGAWTPSLVPSLQGRAVATGQVLAYMKLTDDEQARLANVPTLLNLTTGYFIITPSQNTLKIAKHAYGYLNPVPTHNDAGTAVSQPLTHLTHPSLAIPKPEQIALRSALREMVPWPELADRPFTSTKLCWYTDTPDGDFIIDYHPRHGGSLFLATGASGHGFKFLPVIGDRIVDCVLGLCPDAFRQKWRFDKGEDENTKEQLVVTEDGSRAGVPGLVLGEELEGGKRTSRL